MVLDQGTSLGEGAIPKREKLIKERDNDEESRSESDLEAAKEPPKGVNAVEIALAKLAGILLDKSFSWKDFKQ